MSMTATQLVAYLNAIDVGELTGIEAKLEEARRACLQMEQPGLADTLGEAEQALILADMTTYRKRVETVIARLGHIR